MEALEHGYLGTPFPDSQWALLAVDHQQDKAKQFGKTWQIVLGAQVSHTSETPNFGDEKKNKGETLQENGHPNIGNEDKL